MYSQKMLQFSDYLKIASVGQIQTKSRTTCDDSAFVTPTGFKPVTF